MKRSKNYRYDKAAWPWWVVGMWIVVCAIGSGGLVAVLHQPHARASAALSAAQERWKASGVHHYRLDVRTITLHGGETLQLEVRNEQVVAGWKSDGVTVISPDELRNIGAFFPVATLFTLAQNDLDQHSNWRERLARALPPFEQWIVSCPLRKLPEPVYDPLIGYPHRLFVGFPACQFQQDGIEIRIDALHVLP